MRRPILRSSCLPPLAPRTFDVCIWRVCCRLRDDLLKRRVLPLDERLHVRLPGVVQRLLLLKERHTVLERDLLQPGRLGLGELRNVLSGHREYALGGLGRADFTATLQLLERLGQAQSDDGW
jgi:hypothetical protein